MQILSPTMTKRAKCTVPTLFNPAKIASLFCAIASAACARPTGDLSLSGMIRFIMHWTLSPRWNDGWGPPGRGFTGVNRAHKGTRIHDARNLNRRVSGNRSTKRSIAPSSLGIDIVRSPLEGTPAAHFTRDFIGAQTGLEDGIVGSFDAGCKTAGIEADAFAGRFLILGDLGECKGTHGDPDPRTRPGLRGIVERIARFANCHHQHESGRPPLQAAFKLLEQTLVVRHVGGRDVANAGDRLPGKANRAANAIGSRYPEGMDGVVACASIAFRRADQTDLEYAQLGEPVPVGITECSRVDALGLVRVRVAGRYLELQEICNLQQPVLSSIWLELRDLGELEKVVDITDEEFAERRRDQVAGRPVRQVEAYRHSPDIGPSIMLLRAAQSVGESHRRGNGLSLEVLCNAIGA